MHAIDRRHRCVWDAAFAAQQPGTFFVSMTLPDVHSCAPMQRDTGNRSSGGWVTARVRSEVDENGAVSVSDAEVGRGIRGITAGADSIELRVDLLACCGSACDSEIDAARAGSASPS